MSTGAMTNMDKYKEQRLLIVQVRVNMAEMDAIDDACEILHMNKSELARAALSEYISNHIENDKED